MNHVNCRYSHLQLHTDELQEQEVRCQNSLGNAGVRVQASKMLRTQ